MKNKLLGILYVILALYLVNSAFSFITLDFLAGIDKWIVAIAAVVLVILGVQKLMQPDY